MDQQNQVTIDPVKKHVGESWALSRSKPFMTYGVESLSRQVRSPPWGKTETNITNHPQNILSYAHNLSFLSSVPMRLRSWQSPARTNAMGPSEAG
jgi:hypothetical protein